jgi:hypothetical protein
VIKRVGHGMACIVFSGLLLLPSAGLGDVGNADSAKVSLEDALLRAPSIHVTRISIYPITEDDPAGCHRRYSRLSHDRALDSVQVITLANLISTASSEYCGPPAGTANKCLWDPAYAFTTEGTPDSVTILVAADCKRWSFCLRKTRLVEMPLYSYCIQTALFHLLKEVEP